MKKVLLTLAVFACFMVTNSFAQSLAQETTSAKSELSNSSSTLDQLMAKVNEMRDQANQEFAKEQEEIDNQKASLAQIRKDLEASNADEPNMMADKWPARVAARESLIREEQTNSYKQQVLDLKKADFEHKLKQIESHIVTTFAKQITDFNRLYNSNMKSYLGDLSSIN